MTHAKHAGKRIAVLIAAAVLIISAVIMKFSFPDSDELFKKAGLRADTAVSDGIMYVSFIDVGQGDSTLITCGDTAILIDGGEKGMSQTVVNYLKNNNVDDIDCMIATHPHSDHIGSLGEVMTQFEVKSLIMPEIPERIVPTTVTYEKFLKSVDANVDNVIQAVSGETYTYGELNIDILAPISDYDDLNDMSVVAKVSYGDTSVLLTGDAGNESEKDIINKKYNCKADLLKVGHHGSRTSTSDEWLDTVKPQYAVISCGMGNDYGHPHKELTGRLDKHSVEYYRTDISGTVVFQSDGKVLSKAA